LFDHGLREPIVFGDRICDYVVMFLRKNRKRFSGEIYEYWTLCETVRTERGPRQRVVASLGKLSDEDIEAGWADLEALLDGRRPRGKQQRLEERFGQAERVWVMDRGMVSEKNIAFLRKRQARYIGGTPKSQLRAFEKQLAEEGNWTDVQNGVEARLVEHPDAEGRALVYPAHTSRSRLPQRQVRHRTETGLPSENRACRSPPADLFP
jgi:hypothetical protein